VKRQIVEIELVSPLDARNNNELLPSTSEDTTAKRSADLITAPSENLSGKPKEQVEKPLAKKIKVTPVRALRPTEKKPKNQKNQKSETEPVTKKIGDQTEHAPDLVEIAPPKIPITFKAPSTWKTVVVAQGKDKSVDFATYSASAPTYQRDTASKQTLSDAPPVEMVESVDNEGSKKALRSQSGGRSTGGAGAISDLHAYLKMLNKRVKYFWIPPTGLDRVAVIEFRIKSDGTLLRTKALTHEGKIDPEAEAAAIAAINKAFPFRPLPKDVKAGYLDVRYTFNYRFKQIEGVKNPE